MALGPRELDRNTINCISCEQSGSYIITNMLTTPNKREFMLTRPCKKNSSVTDHSPFVAFAS